MVKAVFKYPRFILKILSHFRFFFNNSNSWNLFGVIIICKTWNCMWKCLQWSFNATQQDPGVLNSKNFYWRRVRKTRPPSSHSHMVWGHTEGSLVPILVASQACSFLIPDISKWLLQMLILQISSVCGLVGSSLRGVSAHPALVWINSEYITILGDVRIASSPGPVSWGLVLIVSLKTASQTNSP